MKIKRTASTARNRKQLPSFFGSSDEVVPHKVRLFRLKERFLVAARKALAACLETQPPHNPNAPYTANLLALVPSPGSRIEKARMLLTALESNLPTFIGVSAERWDVLVAIHGLNPALYRLQELAEAGDSYACAELTKHVVSLTCFLNSIAQQNPEWLRSTTRKLPHWPVLVSPQSSHRVPLHHQRMKSKRDRSFDELFLSLELGAEFFTPITARSRARLGDAFGKVIYRYLTIADVCRQEAAATAKVARLHQEDCRNRKIPFNPRLTLPYGLRELPDYLLKELEATRRTLTSATAKTLLKFPSTIPKRVRDNFGVEGWLALAAYSSASRLPPLSNDSRRQWAASVKLLILAECPSEQQLVERFGHLVCAPSHQRYKAGRLLEDVDERINNLPLN